MKIKRYVAPDMRRAMRQVREKQGPDAIILSSKRIDEGIEVITAIDYDAKLLENQPQPLSLPETPPPTASPAEGAIAFGSAAETWAETPAHESSPAAREFVSGEVAETPAHEPTLIGMKQEVASLRRLLESQLASLVGNDESRRHPVRAAIIRELTALGIAAPLARELASTAGESETAPATAAERLLRERLPVLDGEILDESGAVALVGPTGVGKTTTIAKLAARFVLRHDASALGLITTDGFRIGAQEQLITFGRILGVPVQLVRDGRELAATLESMSDKRLVLIDSAGMSQRDRRIQHELAAIKDNGARIRVLLTLAGNVQHAVLDETIKSFSSLGPVGCVLTKIDEAASLGGALSAMIEHGLPLACVTDGQRVPEDLHRAGSKRCDVIERAIELSRHASADYVEVAANA